jgi:hypothetical protein
MTDQNKQVRFQYPNNKVQRYHLINYLIHKYDLKSYLVIGTQQFEQNYLKINLPDSQKDSIDPNPPTDCPFNPTYKTSTQVALNQIIGQNKKYDIILIDGLHTLEVVEQELKMTMHCLNNLDPKYPSNSGPNSFIIMHDANPLHPILARPRFEDLNSFPQWNGEVWKAIVKFNHDYSHPYIARTVDTDWGCAIIQPILDPRYLPKPPLQSEYLTYEYLDKNRQKLLKLISTTEFRRLY